MLLMRAVCLHASVIPDDEILFLQMYFPDDELVVTTSRSVKPLSQVAENITVITAGEIERMNYHTLLEVLNHVPGLQAQMRNPWTGPVHIQGNEMWYSAIKIDGVTLNSLVNNIAEADFISVQNIERVEVIKGPASSAWGSSLGGVINIITKSSGSHEREGGSISSSVGERETGDHRAEIFGSAGDVSYYIYAGNFSSDGFAPNTGVDLNSVYSGFQWDIATEVVVHFTFGYRDMTRGQGTATLPLSPPFDFTLSANDEFDSVFSTLSLDYAVNNETDLSLLLRGSSRDSLHTQHIGGGGEYVNSNMEEVRLGGTVLLNWKQGRHNAVIGAEYDKGKLDEFESVTRNSLIMSFLPDVSATLDHDLENWAVFINDTIFFDSLSVIPGIRYDNTNIGGEFLSPSLGITYEVSEDTLLRTYTARGFNTPTLSSTHLDGITISSNPDLDVERVWSYQAGIETDAVKYLSIKASVFRHDISDAIVISKSGKWVNNDKVRRDGAEIEIETIPLYNTSLFAGFAYLDVDNRSTGDEVENVAEYTWDIGLFYNDNKSLSAAMKGRYIQWVPYKNLMGSYDDFIWDANVTRRWAISNGITAETFLKVHNIFDGSQYLLEFFKNPGRWVEGGVRLKF